MAARGRRIWTLVVLTVLLAACSSTSGEPVDVRTMLSGKGGTTAAQPTTPAGEASAAGSNLPVASGSGQAGSGVPANGGAGSSVSRAGQGPGSGVAPSASTAASAGPTTDRRADHSTPTTGSSGKAGAASGPPGSPERAGPTRSPDAGGASAATGPVGPPTGPGFTASTISVGLELLDASSSQGARLIGASSTDTGDTKKYATAVVDHLNTNGGIAGRKITPVFHTTNVLTGTWDSHAQAACSTFAEDNKVFAAVASMYQLSEVLSRCLAQHATPVLLNGRAVRDDAMLAEQPDFLYMPSRMSATRFAGVTIDGLAEQGFFEPGAKVGILRFDRPVQARIVSQVMRPKLAKLNVKVVAEEAVTYPDSINGFGTTSAQLSSAVLRLRSAGVTHLLPVDDHGIMCFLFMPQAESQGFRPRYGLSTNNQPFVIEDNMPAEQFKQAVGVGWIPADDVAFERNPGGNPSEDLCRSVFQKAGAQFPSRFAWSNALNYCDSLLFLKAALDRATTLSTSGLRSAVAGLADGGFVSAYSFRTTFSRDRHDGAAAYRWFRFADDCQCVRYEGPVRPI